MAWEGNPHRWRRRAVVVSGRDEATARPEPAHRGREGRTDPGVVDAGGRAGGAARRAAKDTGQFQLAAVQGPQGGPVGEGQAAGAALGRAGGGRALAEEP